MIMKNASYRLNLVKCLQWRHINVPMVMTPNNHLISNNKIELTSFVESFPMLYFMSCNLIIT